MSHRWLGTHPLHLSATYLHSPLAVTKLGFCAPEATGKQVPRKLYQARKKLNCTVVFTVQNVNPELSSKLFEVNKSLLVANQFNGDSTR